MNKGFFLASILMLICVTIYPVTVSAGISSDSESKFIELYQLAEKGQAKEQFLLARCYENGDGVKQDYDEAYKWYMKALEQGNSDAQMLIGYRYLNGSKTIQKDQVKGEKLIRSSAEQGNPDAQGYLSLMYTSVPTFS